MSLSEKKVGIVIVNHNSEKQLEQCLSSLANLKNNNYQISIIDNSLSSLSRKALNDLQKKEQFNLVYLTENKGFSAAANIGIAYYAKIGFDYIWLLNPSMIVEADSLNLLLQGNEADSNKVILGSKVLFAKSQEEKSLNNVHKIWALGGRLNIPVLDVELIGHGEDDSKEVEPVLLCDYVPACSLFFSTAVIRDLSYLPEDYFLYFEEIDWCKRAEAHGYQMKIITKSVVYYNMNNAQSITGDKIYYYNRNKQYFWHKYLCFKQKLKLNALFRKFPNSLKKYFHSYDLNLKEKLFAEVLADFHFIVGKRGKK